MSGARTPREAAQGRQLEEAVTARRRDAGREKHALCEYAYAGACAGVITEVARIAIVEGVV